MIGGFRSNLSITRKTDGNFRNVSAGVCFPKSRINENGGKFIDCHNVDLILFCTTPNKSSCSSFPRIRIFSNLYLQVVRFLKVLLVCNLSFINRRLWCV